MSWRDYFGDQLLRCWCSEPIGGRREWKQRLAALSLGLWECGGRSSRAICCSVTAANPPPPVSLSSSLTLFYSVSVSVSFFFFPLSLSFSAFFCSLTNHYFTSAIVSAALSRFLNSLFDQRTPFLFTEAFLSPDGVVRVYNVQKPSTGLLFANISINHISAQY